jgi:cob(I)alamin adenosyltransferase
MALKIYTKTGDKGTTSLIGGTKLPKSDIRIEAYGTVDELNAHIGFIYDSTSLKKAKSSLKKIQDDLFTIGAQLACDPKKKIKIPIPEIKERDIEFLEKEIDYMNKVLPEMKAFILPAGHVQVSYIHIARCVCRRAERTCVALQEHHENICSIIIKYLNRLSDYLFVFARFTGHHLKAKEIPWKPGE